MKSGELLSSFGVSEAYKPGDIDLGQIKFFARAEDKALLAALIGIFKRNGDEWVMERERFEQIIAGNKSESELGGIASFIGIDSLERIEALGALEFGEDEVWFTDDIVKDQEHSLRFWPSVKRTIRRTIGE